MLIVLVAALLYARVLRFDFVQWDDDWLVYDNPLVQSFHLANLKTVFLDLQRPNRLALGAEYLPVRDLVTMLDWQIWRGRPSGFHLTNLLLYLAGALLFYRILARHHLDPLWSILATLLFVAHPGHVESVAWISDRKSLLALFFVMLAWHSYLDFRQSGRRWAWGQSLLWMLAGAFSKQLVILLPLWLLAYEWTVGGRSLRELWRCGRRVWAAYGSLALILTVWHYWVAQHIGILGWRYGDSAGQTLAYSLVLVRRYLEMLLLPLDPSFLFVSPALHPPTVAEIAGAAGATAAIVFLAVRWRQRRPWAALAGWWFLIGLLPFVQIVAIQNYIAWRYLFASSLALGLLTVEAGQESVGWRRWRSGGLLLGFLWLAFFSWQTLRQVPAWRDSRTFWETALSRQPRNCAAWQNLSEYYARRGDREKALAYARSWTEWRPDWAEAWYTLGLRYQAEEKPEAAVAALEKSVQLDPRHYYPWLYLGAEQLALGRLAEAETAWLRARELRQDTVRLSPLPRHRAPPRINLLYNLALISVQRGDLPLARQRLQQLLAEEPDQTLAKRLLEDLKKGQALQVRGASPEERQP